MSWVAAIAAFIGRIFREIIPALYDELRRPRRTIQVGGSEEVLEEVNDSIRDYYRHRDMSDGHLHSLPPDGGMHPKGPSPTAPPSSSLNHRFQRPDPSILPGSGHQPTR